MAAVERTFDGFSDFKGGLFGTAGLLFDSGEFPAVEIDSAPKEMHHPSFCQVHFYQLFAALL